MNCRIMKLRLIIIINLLLMLFTATAIAGWEVAKPRSVPREPFFQAGRAPAPTRVATAARPGGWEVAKPRTVVPREPMFQAGRAPVAKKSVPTAYAASGLPSQYARLGQPAAIYAVSISGSLKENIERIMSRYHWRVVWKAGYDYNYDGRVTGSSLPNVIEKLLQPFPLQAKMYLANRTIAIVPRSRSQEG